MFMSGVGIGIGIEIEERQKSPQLRIRIRIGQWNYNSSSDLLPLPARFPSVHELIGARKTGGNEASVRETASTDEMAEILDAATATSPPPKVGPAIRVARLTFSLNLYRAYRLQ